MIEEETVLQSRIKSKCKEDENTIAGRLEDARKISRFDRWKRRDRERITWIRSDLVGSNRIVAEVVGTIRR